MSDQNQELAAVLSRLQSFEAKMDAAIAHAQSRKNTTLVMMIIVVIAMAGYLTFAHKQIKQVDASTVVYLAEARIQDYLNQSAPQLTKKLQDQAPEVIGMVEKRLLELPEAVGEQARAYAMQNITKAVPDLEATLQKGLADAIKQAHATHGEPGKPVGDAEMKQIFDELAAVYGKQMQDMVGRLHTNYRQNSGELLDYLRLLAEADANVLDQRQKLHRELVVAVLALLEKYEPGIEKLPTQNPG